MEITFFQIFEQIKTKAEKNAFRKKIIAACKIEPQTWYSWHRRQKVSKQSQLLIAQELKQPVKTLFP